MKGQATGYICLLTASEGLIKLDDHCCQDIDNFQPLGSPFVDRIVVFRLKDLQAEMEMRADDLTSFCKLGDYVQFVAYRRSPVTAPWEVVKVTILQGSTIEPYLVHGRVVGAFRKQGKRGYGFIEAKLPIFPRPVQVYFEERAYIMPPLVPLDADFVSIASEQPLVQIKVIQTKGNSRCPFTAISVRPDVSSQYECANGQVHQQDHKSDFQRAQTGMASYTQNQPGGASTCSADQVALNSQDKVDANTVSKDATTQTDGSLVEESNLLLLQLLPHLRSQEATELYEAVPDLASLCLMNFETN